MCAGSWPARRGAGRGGHGACGTSLARSLAGAGTPTPTATCTSRPPRVLPLAARSPDLHPRPRSPPRTTHPARRRTLATLTALGPWRRLAPMDAINTLLDAADATPARRIATTGVLYALSDVLAQFIVPSTASVRPSARSAIAIASGGGGGGGGGCAWDAPRTLRLALYGALVFAPLNSLWLGSVIERVPAGTLAKVALDQLTMSPFGLFLFLVYTTWLTPPATSAPATATVTAPSPTPRSSLRAQWRPAALAARTAAARRKIRLDFLPTLRRSWAVWVPVQILTIGLVPPRERLLFVNIVALLWNAFLSLYVVNFVGCVLSPVPPRPALLLPTRDAEHVMCA